MIVRKKNWRMGKFKTLQISELSITQNSNDFSVLMKLGQETPNQLSVEH